MEIDDFEESEPPERIPLQVHFASTAEMESVYRADISRGGVFVATSEPPALGTFVEVEFCVDEWPESLRFEGEVVRSQVDDGGQAGVAVAFSLPTPELRLAFRSQMDAVVSESSCLLTLDSLFRLESTGRAELPALDDALAASLMDLVGAGLSLARMLEVIPESEERIRNRLTSLVEAGVISPLG